MSTHAGQCRSAAVVGGGWSGIAAAWYLHRAAYDVTLFDQGQGLGGRSATALLGGGAVILGGRDIGSSYVLFREFVAAPSSAAGCHRRRAHAAAESGPARRLSSGRLHRGMLPAARVAKAALTRRGSVVRRRNLATRTQ